MRRIAAISVFLIFCGPASAQRLQPEAAQPSEFEIGRRTFFDFGPPFDFYELFIVRQAESAISIERITLTPANACIAPAKFETASVSLSESIPGLLGTNPCSIPDKDLRRELKRCKKCLVFSGENVTMQVNCGSQTRLIRSDILDRDMFDPAVKTPVHTSWTIGVLQRLDEAVGPGVINKPVFSMPDDVEPPVESSGSAAEQELSTGRYDALFPGAEKVSELYRAARKPPVLRTVELVRSFPVAPEVFIPPEYPPLAKMARVHGPVTFSIDVTDTGAASDLIFESGPKLLYQAVRKAVIQWKFPKEAFSVQIHATIGFALNCPQQSDSGHD